VISRLSPRSAVIAALMCVPLAAACPPAAAQGARPISRAHAGAGAAGAAPSGAREIARGAARTGDRRARPGRRRAGLPTRARVGRTGRSTSARAAARRHREVAVRHGRAARRRHAADVATVDRRRAIASFEAMQRRFYIPSAGLYKGSSSSYSYLWPFSQALAATVSVSGMPGEHGRFAHELHLRLEGLATYWGVTSSLAVAGRAGVPSQDMPSYIGAPTAAEEGGATSYYDDNEWVAIELVRIYSQYGDVSALQDAERVMDFIAAAWQSDPKLACPGGVPFSDSPQNTDRNTVTDAPAAELGALLYRITGEIADLRFAEGAYEWVRRCLSEPQQLYADHIGPEGAVNHALWSYNQGTMVGAGTLLYQATGNGAFLAQAQATAAAALSHFSLSRLEAENPFFAAVYLRNLLYLDSVTHGSEGPRLAQEYADRAWGELRMSDSGLFVFGGPPEPSLLGQSAIAQVYAMLSEPATRYF